MVGRKRTAEGTLLNCSTETDKILDPDSDSDNEQSIPKSSKQIMNDVNQSWTDSNNELLKQNPFLIPNVLACLCENSSTEALFKNRLVSHIWNKLAVNAINQDNSSGVRLIKIFDPDRMDKENVEEKIITKRGTQVINIKELISTLHEGRLEKSTLTRIYLNSSITKSDLNNFLHLNGQNIRTVHYDGESLEDLRQILQTCSTNLKSLSLWRSWVENNEGLFKVDDDDHAAFKFPHLESLVIVSGEMCRDLCFTKFDDGNICNPSKEFLSDLVITSPNLKSLSARFYDSFILESGLSFKNLTTLCIKFKIRNDQLRALCGVGLNLKQLHLQGLLIEFPYLDRSYNYLTDPERMEFRQVLLNFIQTQANTLEYFAVSLYLEERYCGCGPGDESAHEEWSTLSGFPRMPHLQTFIYHECCGIIPKEEFSYLFPKLRNLEIDQCIDRHVDRLKPHNTTDYPMEIPISSNATFFVQNIRGISPTMETAQIFPAVTELHVVNKIPHKLPIYWPKLKHLYLEFINEGDDQSEHVDFIRRISKFIVGISKEESERIEKEGLQHASIFFGELTNLELPRSRPSIFNLNELETLEFRLTAYEYSESHYSPGIESALKVLITLGLSRMTHLKKLNVILEQKQRPSRYFAGLPQKSLKVLANTYGNTNHLDFSTNCDEFGRNTRERKTREWTLEVNLNHHKSEWKGIDELFREDPDICDLGIPRWIEENEVDAVM